LAWGLASAADCSLKVESDGTATVRGEVTRNDQGCARDIACYLQLSCDGRNVRVIYDPGDSPHEFTNEDATSVATRMKPGDVIDAHGGYSKFKDEITIDIYSKASYWIKVVSKQDR